MSEFTVPVIIAVLLYLNMDRVIARIHQKYNLSGPNQLSCSHEVNLNWSQTYSATLTNV